MPGLFQASSPTDTPTGEKHEIEVVPQPTIRLS
jgi:hypothetical protein